MAIRLALGHIEGLDDTITTFAQQLGLTSIQFRPADRTARLARADLARALHCWDERLSQLRSRERRRGKVLL